MLTGPVDDVPQPVGFSYECPEYSYLRQALWKVHGSTCYFCGNPIENMSAATVDHVVPQAPRRNDVEQWRGVRAAFQGMYEGWDIYSVGNMRLTHFRCNLDKRNAICTWPVLDHAVRAAVGKVLDVRKRYAEIEAASAPDVFLRQPGPFDLDFFEVRLGQLLTVSRMVAPGSVLQFDHIARFSPAECRLSYEGDVIDRIAGLPSLRSLPVALISGLIADAGESRYQVTSAEGHRLVLQVYEHSYGTGYVTYLKVLDVAAPAPPRFGGLLTSGAL